MTGAAILAISAVFATKANKKFAATLSTAYMGSGFKLQQSTSSPKIFTGTSGAGFIAAYVYMYTLTNNTALIGSSTAPAQLKTVGNAHNIFLNHTNF